MRANLDNDEDDPALISKKFWSHVKATAKSTRIPETVYYQNTHKNRAIDKANLFNTYFYDQFSTPSKYDISINFNHNPHGTSHVDISPNTIYDLLKKINSNKASGPDGIHGKILKHCAYNLSVPLSLLFNLSFATGSLPLDWKMAHIVPVHKKDSKINVENVYMTIS